MMTIKYAIIASLFALYSALSVAAETVSDKSLYYGGIIYSADRELLHPEAVGVENGKIVAVGNYAYVVKKLGKDAKKINLNGRYMMPGLIDTHVHAAFAGFQEMTVHFPDNLETAAQLKEFLASATQNPQLYLGGVQYFSNVSLRYWSKIPLLKQVFNSGEYQNIPVVLAGYDAHTGWFNDAMRRKSGLDKRRLTELAPGVAANFGTDNAGNLTGFVSEGAWDYILSAMPPVSDEKIAASIILAARKLNSFGITAWMDPISNVRPVAPIFSASPDRYDEGLLPAYTSLSKKGELTGHVSALALVGITASPDIIDDVELVKKKFSTAPDVKVVGLKILQDGVLEYPSQSAKLSQSYQNRPGYSGDQSLRIQQFNELIRRADARHLTAHFHVIGDRAASEALGAVAYARSKNGSGMLHSLTHLQIVSPENLDQFKPLNVAASMQFLWSGKETATTTLLEGLVPSSLLQRLYPAGSLIRHGAIVAGASDWPVSMPNPFEAMYTGITRKGSLGVLPPDDERISRNAAKVIVQPDKVGSITVGKSADFAVLDRNVEQVSDDSLKETRVLWTVFKGQCVYDSADYCSLTR
ncbi:amidohydrolase [Serratia ureilytica]|uniref:amidohydrolase n=1 Tax=Serratia ureilytica TaxID=300181 RepID=UPI0037221155